MHRIALAMARGADAGKDRVRDPSGREHKRTFVFDDAFSPNWDESILGPDARRSSRFRYWRMAREVARRNREYDAVVSWGEKLSLAMLVAHQKTRPIKPHIAMMYQFEKPNIRVPLAAFKRHLHAVVTWSSVQRRALIEHIGYPAERVYLIRHYVDQVFYSPRAVETDTICAVGAEMRDYATLKQAVHGTEIPVRIAADHVRIPGRIRALRDRRVAIEDVGGPDVPGLVQGRLSATGLRDLYARSRFVVVPLLPSDTDNGITVILEAMAMGKAVICSATRGQVDAIEHGVTGLMVPVGDAQAMRAAIVDLWNDPARAAQMGSNARRYIERHHTLEVFTAATRSAAEASLGDRPAPDGWWGTA